MMPETVSRPCNIDHPIFSFIYHLSLHSNVLCCVVLCCAVLCCVVLCCAVLLVHAWDYRRSIVQRHENLDLMHEFNYTREKINENFSNYSAWHYRSKLFPRVYASVSAEEMDKLIDTGLLRGNCLQFIDWAWLC